MGSAPEPKRPSAAETGSPGPAGSPRAGPRASPSARSAPYLRPHPPLPVGVAGAGAALPAVPPVVQQACG